MKNQALIPNKDGSPGDVSEDLAALAAEMAKDLIPAETVAAAWGLDEKELAALQSSPEFDALLQTERAKWNLPGNTNNRIKAKNLMSVEAGSLSMIDIVNDPAAGPIARIKAFAELVRVGGADNAGMNKAAAANKGGMGAGDRFSISIHIGGDKEVTVSALTNQAQEEGEVIDAVSCDAGDSVGVEVDNDVFSRW